MSLTAPSALDVADPLPGDIDDAVIREARRRARRRRRIYGGLLAAGMVAAAVFVAVARSGSSSSPPPAGAAAPTPDAVDGLGQGPTLVAHFGAVHGGWVLVYSDGGMLLYPDATAEVHHGSSAFGHNGHSAFGQRRLSAQGMLLVRSGAIPLKDFLTDRALLESASVWAEPDFRPYPTTPGQPGALGYVACVVDEGHDPRVRPELASQLPGGALALTRGTQRTFRFLPYQALMHAGGELTKETSGAPIPQECFALDVARARALTRMTNPTDFDPYNDLDAGHTVSGYLTFTVKNGAQVGLDISVALPDRVIVATGG